MPKRNRNETIKSVAKKSASPSTRKQSSSKPIETNESIQDPALQVPALRVPKLNVPTLGRRTENVSLHEPSVAAFSSTFNEMMRSLRETQTPLPSLAIPEKLTNNEWIERLTDPRFEPVIIGVNEKRTLNMDNFVIEVLMNYDAAPKQIILVTKVYQPTSKVPMDSFLKYFKLFSKQCHFSKEFYAALNYDPDQTMDDFLAGLGAAEEVRTVAFCHGCIGNPFVMPIRFKRITLSPNGLCSMQNNHRVGELLTLTGTNAAFSVAAVNIMDEQISKFRQRDSTKGFKKDEHEKLFRSITTVHLHSKWKKFNKQKQDQEMVFDKRFSNHPNLCFLFVGYSPRKDNRYVYRNLFVLQEHISMQELLERHIPKCTKWVMADFSCNTPCKDFIYKDRQSQLEFPRFVNDLPHDYFSRYGGQRRSKARKTKRLRAHQMKFRVT